MGSSKEVSKKVITFNDISFKLNKLEEEQSEINKLLYGEYNQLQSIENKQEPQCLSFYVE